MLIDDGIHPIPIQRIGMGLLPNISDKKSQEVLR